MSRYSTQPTAKNNGNSFVFIVRNGFLAVKKDAKAVIERLTKKLGEPISKPSN